MPELQTFCLPDYIHGSVADTALAKRIIAAWRKDGILQIRISPSQQQICEMALLASKQFFAQPLAEKSGFISDLTYSGYIGSKEEITANQADYSEVFTLCKDVPLHDPRVMQQWPCHGPVPWPNAFYKQSMEALMRRFGNIGERMLRLTALGLGLDINTLTQLSTDGWHHMRVLRFPKVTDGSVRGIGAHTDYGLLVIATQDDVGGLYIRPPVAGEQRPKNWRSEESSAGVYETQEPWHFVKPVRDVVTVFPGDIMQFFTHGYLLSTPHKVKLNTRERFALAYFHEPNFNASVYPIGAGEGEHIHYGTHFTNMFMRSYPNRITTRRIIEQGLLEKLEENQLCESV